MNALKKLTTVLIVPQIEPCLPEWQQLGYEVTVKVPETGELGFAILNGPAGELMLQTVASLREDLPDVAALQPKSLLYGDVKSLREAKAQLSGAKVLVAHRKTFYGATESWLLLQGEVVLGLSEHG